MRFNLKSIFTASERTEFIPPIENRSNDELIEMANSTTEYWQKAAIDKAREELARRGITREQQDKVIDKWNTETEKFEIKRQKQLNKNELKSYDLIDMVGIFLLAPFIFLGRIDIGMSLPELKENNFKIKYKQRKLLLLSGLFFYIILFILLGNI